MLSYSIDHVRAYARKKKYRLFPSAASGKYYVLSGQHRYEAARAIYKKALDAAKEPPAWTSEFRCLVVRPGTDLTTRQLIAGKTQAAQATVLTTTLTDRIRWFLTELNDAVERSDDNAPKVNRTSLLRLTYMKTGCREKEDGSMVCVLFLFYSYTVFVWNVLLHFLKFPFNAHMRVLWFSIWNCHTLRPVHRNQFSCSVAGV